MTAGKGSPRTLSEAKGLLAQGATTVEALVQGSLQKIDASKDLNAFLGAFNQSAIQQARTVDKRLAEGNAGELAGLVLAIKDNICYKDHRVGAASHILEEFTSLYNATVVDRLLAADAVIIGRTNCDEFAMGSSSENSAFGPVKNPVAPDHVPGGSSGGSAAAVAAGLCIASLGSDTGGSIRQPAAFTGIVGFKPTYGRVSRYGLIAFASSFDQIGPFANNVADAAKLYEVMAGVDERDGTTSSKTVAPVELSAPKKLRIAWYRECFEHPGLDPEIKAAMGELMEKLRSEGHEVEPVELPMLDKLVPTYYVLSTAEASSNLARYDGIHYGRRSKGAVGVDETYRLSRTEGFGPEVKRRIMLGSFVLSAGYYDAYYAKAQRVRRMIRDNAAEVLSDHDLVISPTSPITAFKRGSMTNDPVAMYLQDIFTVQANLCGFPAISLPAGKHSNGLPIGVHLMANAFKDAELLQAANYMEGLLTVKG